MVVAALQPGCCSSFSRRIVRWAPPTGVVWSMSVSDPVMRVPSWLIPRHRYDPGARRCIPSPWTLNKTPAQTSLTPRPPTSTPILDPDIDTEPLERSQDAIDQAREAAREAFKDNPPDADPTEGAGPES